jgi:hypothetical protein
MTDRVNAWIRKNVVRLVCTAFLIGVAWATLGAAIARKADKTTVEQMAADIRVIKTLVCRGYPNDSACLAARER